MSVDIYNEDCIKGLSKVPDGSIDVVLTDPPYLYLKNQRLDCAFDEEVFFTHIKRIVRKDGFIVMFGRGTSFYRWNTILANLGFKFKEEIIWNKSYCTSPLMAISRVHETISIHTKGKGVINRCKVPYLEIKQYDLRSIIQDIKRLRVVLNNLESLKAIEQYLQTGTSPDCVAGDYVAKFSVSVSSNIKVTDPTVSLMNSICTGLKEQSIIKVTGDHYSAIHPTQKPVRLLERLLALVSKPGAVVCDPFMGSGSSAIACMNTGRDFIGYEIDRDYFDGASKRISDHKQKQGLFKDV